jgi:hypothetical protein
VVDVSGLDNVEIYSDGDGGMLAKVGGGIRLGNLYRALWENGNWSFNAGSCPSVGVMLLMM